MAAIAPTTSRRSFAIPPARGPLSRTLIAHLTESPGRDASWPRDEIVSLDPIGDEDLQLALYLCYELHYSELVGVDPAWEWDPALLAFRASLERPFEAAVRASVPASEERDLTEVGDALRRIVAGDDGPPLSR
ncbi:MAG TPA: iron-containing redox enzyme family protein, partial [Conexibacter sp.]|nr:iron-containing redox enzyme family protein [Conexibacter sp.]